MLSSHQWRIFLSSQSRVFSSNQWRMFPSPSQSGALSAPLSLVFCGRPRRGGIRSVNIDIFCNISQPLLSLRLGQESRTCQIFTTQKNDSQKGFQTQSDHISEHITMSVFNISGYFLIIFSQQNCIWGILN